MLHPNLMKLQQINFQFSGLFYFLDTKEIDRIKNAFSKIFIKSYRLQRSKIILFKKNLIIEWKQEI